MDWVIAIFGLLIGGGIGAGIGYLLAERKMRRRDASALTALAVAEQRTNDLSAQLSDEKKSTAELRLRLSSEQSASSAMQAQLVAAQENLAEQRRLLDSAETALRQAFAGVSAEALAKNNEAFLTLAAAKFGTISAEATGALDQRKTQIEALLTPMRELLDQYQKRVGDIEKSRVESYSMLREQLGTLAETQRTLNTQTGQLVSALRRPQTRGQWGEITLRRLVELAGLSGKCDFSEQTSVDGEDGKLRPDMIINLPGDRQIVIDCCKTALDAFLDAAAAVDEDARKICLQRHCQQVRARARELSAKAYWAQFKNSPEYVVMFLPGEAFLYAAVEIEPAIVEEAMRAKVIIATPTTLIGLLKTIEHGWRHEQMTQNAEEIRQLGKELYDRIAVLATHFEKLGGNLNNTVASYNSALASLETRVLITGRKIAELGARSDKTLPEISPVEERPRTVSAQLLFGEAQE